MGNELNCANPFGDYYEEEEEEEKKKKKKEEEEEKGAGEEEGDDDKTGAGQELERAEETQRKQDGADKSIKAGGHIYIVDVERLGRQQRKESNVTDVSKLSSEGNRFICDEHL